MGRDGLPLTSLRDEQSVPSLQRPSMALLGPHPPPLGGYAIYVDVLMRSRLQDRFGVHCIDTGHPVQTREVPLVYRYPAMVALLARDLCRIRSTFRIPSIRGIHMLVDYNIPRFLALSIEFEQAGRAGWRRAERLRGLDRPVFDPAA